MKLSDQIAFVFPLSHLPTMYLRLYPRESASKACPPWWSGSHLFFCFQVAPLFSIFNFSFSRRSSHQHTNISSLKNKSKDLLQLHTLFQWLPHFSAPLGRTSSWVTLVIISPSSRQIFFSTYSCQHSASAIPLKLLWLKSSPGHLFLVWLLSSPDTVDQSLLLGTLFISRPLYPTLPGFHSTFLASLSYLLCWPLHLG